MKAVNIKWDVDYKDELLTLPTIIDIPNGMTDEDDISDYLSNVTGYCHKGFCLITIRALNEKDNDNVITMDEISGYHVADSLDSENYGYGLFIEDKLIGYCTVGNADCEEILKKNPDWREDALILSDVFVKPEFRNHNFATLLVDEVLSLSVKVGSPVFIFLLDDTLENFYSKLGFEWAFDNKEYIMVKK